MSVAVLIYESGSFRVWRGDNFGAHEEIAKDVPAWCTHNSEGIFNLLHCYNNMYMIVDYAQESPYFKVAVLVDCEGRIQAIDQNRNDVDISTWGIPLDIFEAKILSHEERMLADPIYRRRNSS